MRVTKYRRCVISKRAVIQCSLDVFSTAGESWVHSYCHSWSPV